MPRPLFVAIWLTLNCLTILRAQRVAVEVSPFPALGDGNRVTELVEGNDRRLWCAFLDRVQWHDTEGTFDLAWADAPEKRNRTIRCMATGPDGTLWIGGAEGVWHVPPGGRAALDHDGPRTKEVWSLVVDRAGTAWVGTTKGLLRCRAEGSDVAVPLPWTAPGVTGLATFEDRIWCWNATGLWWANIDAPEVRWRPMPGAPAEVRGLLRWGDQTVVASNSGVSRVSDQGEWQPLYRGEEMQFVTYMTSCVGFFWFASHTRIWRLALQGGALQEVRLFQRGEPLDVTSGIHGMISDRQGLLWFALKDGAYRAGLVEGVENLLIDAMAEDQYLTALIETGDSQVIAAQMRGTVLQRAGDTWTRLETPWHDEPDSKERLECLLSDRRGRLWLGTRADGVWRREECEWVQIGADQGITGVRSILEDAEGQIWLAGVSNVWRVDLADQIHGIPVRRPRPDVDPRPCVLSATENGQIWMGTYREGLMRYDPAAGCMAPADIDGIGNAVLELRTDRSGGDRLWALSTIGVHRIDTNHDRALALRGNPRNGVTRSLAQATDGSLWMALPQHLVHFDPHTGHSRMFPARLGGHPRGYGFRGALHRSNGEIWMGSKGGYTRILAGCEPSPQPLQLLGFEVLCAGASHLRKVEAGATATVKIAPGPVRIRPQLIDRTSDLTPATEVVQQDQGNERLHRSRTGQFDDLPDGAYEMTALVTRTSGETQPIPLGHLMIATPPIAWYWWAMLGTALVGGSLWFTQHRRQSRRRRRHVVVEDMLREQRTEADHLLDIAFLAVATAEECARCTVAEHTSIWIRDRGSRERLLLAEFGTACPDAEQRADCCCGSRPETGENLQVQCLADGHDVLVRIRDQDNLEFEVLLHATAKADEATLAAVRAKTTPVLTAMHKLAWLGRLESERAETAASLMADVHDLRSPLTTLRLCAGELLRRNDATAPALRELTKLLANAAERVVQSIDDLVQNQNRKAVATTVAGAPQALVVERVQCLTPSARSKRIEIVLRPTGREQTATFDPVWLGRVIENLIGNAIKYSPLGSTVTVTCEVVEGQFLMHVEDQGPGFSESELEAVFLPGRIGSARPTGAETQSGMGLWIARQAMRSMGGDLRIERRLPGAGARIALFLPTQPAAGTVGTGDLRSRA